MKLYEISEQKLNYFRYSKNTAKIYLHYIDEFEQSLSKHHSRITANDIQKYINEYHFKSGSQQNQIISALKFAWEKGLGKKYIKINFKRPKGDKKLPRVIDQVTVKNKIEAIKNLKHKAILALAFSDGLRVSEITNLKIKDIDSTRMIVHINNAKGRKDRIVPLSQRVLQILRDYFKQYKPVEYLFNGQTKKQYSSSSCNNIFKKYIDKDGHFHILRHSGLTALMENGTNLRVIQKIAGHKSSKTTEIYTHTSINLLQNVALAM